MHKSNGISKNRLVCPVTSKIYDSFRVKFKLAKLLPELINRRKDCLINNNLILAIGMMNRITNFCCKPLTTSKADSKLILPWFG